MRDNTTIHPESPQTLVPSTKLALSVLLLEDNDDHASLILRLLAKASSRYFSVHRVQSVAQALAILAEGLPDDRLGKKLPDVVLTDLNVDDSRGLDTVAQLHTHHNRMPIVALTSLNDLEVGMQAVHAGAQDFLVKTELTSASLVRSVMHAIERKRISVELAKKTAQLEQANQELDHFVRFLSHDIRSPLSVVLMDLDSVAHEAANKLSPDANELIDSARQEVRDISKLVAELLAATRREAKVTDLAEVDLNQVVDKVVQRMHRSVPQDFLPRLRMKRLPKVRGSATLLEQVFINLLTNAGKYRGSKAPQVRMETHLIPHPTDAHQRQWQIVLADNGQGIPANMRESIFNLFDRGNHNLPESRTQGVGIGLTIVRQIMQLHQGTVHVTDSPLGGAAFVLTFPAPAHATDPKPVAS